MKILYKNSFGTVEFSGKGTSDFCILAIDGLQPFLKEYEVATYTGYDGQETLSSRALPRTITISAEYNGNYADNSVKKVLKVLEKNGEMTIENNGICRSIICNQILVSEVNSVLKGKIAGIVVQFVCDSPYFTDEFDTVVPLYARSKLLVSPFSLPTAFGGIIIGGDIEITGDYDVEPIISMYYPSPLEAEENVIITNETTGKSIKLNYAPIEKEIITIDVKNRRINGTVGGNLISFLSDDTFLGDFILEKGRNIISVSLGDTVLDFNIECKYRNLYYEAVMV